MIKKEDILVAIFTCKKYHNTRIKIATQTWMKLIPKENLYIFSDCEQLINGYMTIKMPVREKYSQDNRLNDTVFAQSIIYPFFLSKASQYKIFVHLYDDTFYDINRMVQVYNQNNLQSLEFVYSGKVTNYYNNDMGTPLGYVHGGFGYHLNANFIQLIYDDICNVYEFNITHKKQILKHEDIKYIDDKRVGISAKLKRVKPIELFHNGDDYVYCWGMIEKSQILDSIRLNNYGSYHFYDQTVQRLNVNIDIIQKRSLRYWYDMYKIIQENNA